MKRKIFVALLLVCTMIYSLVAFTGCGNKGKGQKQVPVYQGMTITNYRTAKMGRVSSSGIELLGYNNSNNGDNGNHNGHYKGDHTDRNDTIDEENPYPGNNKNENIEEEIKSSFNVIGSPDTIYYTEPYQDIYINIHIDNPDSFEIMSFTLNGKKYSSYMFEEGSDMETIILKYNVGDAAGIIEYTIDAIKYVDGTEIKDVIIDGNKTVMAGIKTENQVAANITNVNIGSNALAFNVNIKDNNALIEFSNGALKAVLYDGFSIIAEKDLHVGDNTVSFDGLQTNTLYQYAVIGYYDNLSGNGFGMNVLYKDAFYTDSVVLFDDITVGQENISFSFLWHEDHQNKSISALKLYKGDIFVKSIDVAATSVSELFSNTTYKLVAEYLNGNNTESIYLEFTTEAKAVPSFVVKNENVTADSIAAEYDVIDVDNILSYYKVELYKGNTLVLENTNKNIDFTDLNYYTDYTVKITCMYDLNDANGEQTDTYDYTYKTLPYIDVIECNVANTSAVSEGETIFMSVKLNNPLGMSVESVVINGETYNVTGASTKNKIFVEIVYNGQFAGGDTYLKIDNVNAKIDNKILNVEPKTVLSDNVFINGKLEVLKVEFVNANFEPIDWAFPSQAVYVLVTLDNPTGYHVDKINSNVSSVFKLDDNRWYYQTSMYTGWNGTHLSDISYHNEFLEKTISYSDIKTDCYVVNSNNPIYISNANDLKNMQGGYYYELANDIDLSGMEWIGSDLNGVLNGKGYSIKNMSFVGSVKNTNAYLGLFKQGNGVIQNLNIENATIIADIIENDKNDYDAYCGAFVAYPNKMIISHCSVDEYSTFGITNTTNASVYVGGFAGIVYYSDIVIKNSINRASISASCAQVNEMLWDREEYSGGFIGSISPYSNASFFNCINDGTINGFYSGGYIGFVGDFSYVGDTRICIIDSIASGILEGEYVGGFIGFEHNNSSEYKSSLIISNCLNNSSITANRSGGGIAAIICFAELTIKDCVSVGNIIKKSPEASISYSVCEISNQQNSTMIANCYSMQVTENYIFEFCTISQLNSKEFYTETLGWSEDIWDFSDLDVENGKYPKLK